MQPNISVITEDIYLKLRVVVHYQKGNSYNYGEVILQFFLTKLCPFFDSEFSKCSYSQALAPACGALVFLLLYIHLNPAMVMSGLSVNLTTLFHTIPGQF